ncbi:diaminopimelate decarboxylase (plasmid) [Ralstonia solanacearum]|nr:diaminopimelate decarboxylase [Ralstonia solanacearum]
MFLCEMENFNFSLFDTTAFNEYYRSIQNRTGPADPHDSPEHRAPLSPPYPPSSPDHSHMSAALHGLQDLQIAHAKTRVSRQSTLRIDRAIAPQDPSMPSVDRRANILSILEGLERGESLASLRDDLPADVSRLFRATSRGKLQRGLNEEGRQVVVAMCGTDVLKRFDKAFELDSAWGTRGTKYRSGPAPKSINLDPTVISRATMGVLEGLERGESLASLRDDLPADVSRLFRATSRGKLQRGLNEEGRQVVVAMCGTDVLKRFDKAFELDSAWGTRGTKYRSGPAPKSINLDPTVISRATMGVLEGLERGESLASLLDGLTAEVRDLFSTASTREHPRGLSNLGREVVAQYGADVLDRFDRAFRRTSAWVKPRMPAKQSGKTSRKNASRPPDASLAQQLTSGGLMKVSSAFLQAHLDLATIAKQAGMREEELRPYFNESGLTEAGSTLLAQCDLSTQAAVLWNVQAGLTNRAASERGDIAHPQHSQSPQSSIGLPRSDWSGWQWNMNTPQHEVTGPYQSPQPSASDTFSGLSSFNQPAYHDREFDLNTPQEVTQPWYQTPSPPQSPQSSVGLPRSDWSGWQWDMNTPQHEVTGPYQSPQAWHEPVHYDMQASTEPSATPAVSPERIVVEDAPSPHAAQATGLAGLTATSWLGDEHINAYMQVLSRQLEGQHNAELLNFADPLQVEMLISGDETQKASVLRRLAGKHTAPIVFLPINDTNRHWSLLVIDRRSKQAFHYDSSISPDEARKATYTRQYQLAQQAATAMGIKASVRGKPIARQQDGHSCGDHVLRGIELLAHRVIDGTFDQGDMDLRDIAPDRTLIADVIAHAEQLNVASRARTEVKESDSQKKKKSKWWKLF